MYGPPCDPSINDAIWLRRLIICTIPPSSLNTWNHTRLKQHKTVMVQFFPTSPQMQNDFIKAILSINTDIISNNQSKHAFTPKLIDTIIKNWAKTKQGAQNPLLTTGGWGTPHGFCEGTGTWLGYSCRPSWKTDLVPWLDPYTLSPWLSPFPQTLTLTLIPTLSKEETGNSKSNI